MSTSHASVSASAGAESTVVMGATYSRAGASESWKPLHFERGPRENGPGVVTGNLVGREVETRTIEEFLERAESGPQILVLTGEPGIGKSALWEAALER